MKKQYGLMEELCHIEPLISVKAKLYKKDEFDDDGIPLHGIWEQFHVVLSDSKLEIYKTTTKKTSMKQKFMVPLSKSISDLSTFSFKEKQTKHGKSRSKLEDEANFIETDSDENLFEVADEIEGRLENIVISKTSPVKEILKSPIYNQNEKGKKDTRSPLNDKLSLIEFDENTKDNRDLFPEAAKLVDTIKLDYLCRIIPIPDHKKEFVWRVMLNTQRSFLMKANSLKEMDKWINAMKFSIAMVFFSYKYNSHQNLVGDS